MSKLNKEPRTIRWLQSGETVWNPYKGQKMKCVNHEILGGDERLAVSSIKNATWYVFFQSRPLPFKASALNKTLDMEKISSNIRLNSYDHAKRQSNATRSTDRGLVHEDRYVRDQCLNYWGKQFDRGAAQAHRITDAIKANQSFYAFEFDDNGAFEQIITLTPIQSNV